MAAKSRPGADSHRYLSSGVAVCHHWIQGDSRMSHTFGKITIADGVRVLEDVGGTGLSGVLIGNESGLTCEVVLVGASVKRTLYPGTVDFFEVTRGTTWNGNLQIDPMADLTNFSSYPGSYVRIDTFGPGERPAGQYPMALPRLSNVGNTVDTNTVSAVTTNVTNDGNPSGTVFIEATQSGNASGSNVAIGNDGSAIFAQFVSSVFKQIFKIIPGASPEVLLGKGVKLHIVDNNNVDNTVLYMSNSNIVSFQAGTNDVFAFTDHNGNALFYAQTEVNGGFQLNSDIFINGTNHAGNAYGPILGVDTSGNTIVQAHPTNNQVVILDKNGAVLSTIDSNGCINMAGKIQTANGDTSGSMTIQEIFAGGSKWLIIKQNNYKQAGAAQQFTLSNTFTGPFGILNLGCGGMEVLQAGTKQSINVLTALAAAGGTFAAQTNIQQASIGWCNTNINQIQSQGGYATAHTGVTILAGF